MSHKMVSASLIACMAFTALTQTGCVGLSTGPTLGIFGIPIPVTPYLQDKQEDRFWNQERYATVPIMGPLSSGGPAVALDPPSDDEVMRALERARPIEGGLPLLHETQRNNVRIVKQKIADYVDPPRFVPLIGPAQLHHAHYKCTIYFSEVHYIGWPIPYTEMDEEAIEVIYIDHNHFHMCGNVDPGIDTQF